MAAVFEMDLPCDLAAGGLGRRATKDFLIGRCTQQLIDDVLLVVGELVINAVRHTGDGCHLRVHCDESEIVVEVRDADGRPPVGARLEAVSLGRGLGMVQMVTRRWGIERRVGGKTVWAEFAMIAP